MVHTASELARAAGATMQEVSEAAGINQDHLLDIRRQVAELHADVAEIEIRLRRLEQVAPPSIIRKNGNGGPR